MVIQQAQEQGEASLALVLQPAFKVTEGLSMRAVYILSESISPITRLCFLKVLPSTILTTLWTKLLTHEP